ncbi:unnamed protein product [Spodoptera littoralis]|uniref:Uncharacterized protein n=1 Tax=Spodoptera littoralis TaxID=7109 RepID=A0A9P0HYC8_SPOLI|nr:unnamed protein product [Spodoptera littoralis]CAH1637734.1 unnamed protein product [Spodoptera littoralis]
MEPGKASNNLKEDQSQKREPSTSTGSKTSRPRRGRPAGANRTPLSLEERRARNAQYERERREDLAEAHSELAEAAGCDPNISTDDLMTLVITKLQQTIPAEDIRLANVDLEAQIAKCIEQLPPDYIVSDDEEEVQPEEPNTRKRKPSHRDTFSDDKRMRLGGMQMPAVGWMISPADFAEAVPGPRNYEWEDVDAFLAEQLSSFNAEAPPVVPSVALPPNPPMTPLATQRPRNYEWEDVDAFLAEQLSSFNAEAPPVVPSVALPPNPPMTPLATQRPRNYEWEDVDAFCEKLNSLFSKCYIYNNDKAWKLKPITEFFSMHQTCASRIQRMTRDHCCLSHPAGYHTEGACPTSSVCHQVAVSGNVYNPSGSLWDTGRYIHKVRSKATDHNSLRTLGQVRTDPPKQVAVNAKILEFRKQDDMIHAIECFSKGTISADFHTEGNTPSVKDFLNSKVIGRIRLLAQPRRNTGGKPSVPEPLVLFNVRKGPSTVSLVISSVDIKLLEVLFKSLVVADGNVPIEECMDGPAKTP